MSKKYNLIAEAYLKAHRDALSDSLVVNNMAKIMDEPMEGLALIQALISQSMNDLEIAYVAAGPLEDLFIEHHDVLFGHLDKLLRNDIKMRKALTGVWVRQNTDARQSLDKLLNKYHLKYGSL